MALPMTIHWIVLLMFMSMTYTRSILVPHTGELYMSSSTIILFIGTEYRIASINN